MLLTPYLTNYFFKMRSGTSAPVDLRIEELGKSTKKQRMLDFWLLLSIVMIGVAVIPLSLGEEKDRKTLDAVLLSPASEGEIVLAKGAWGFFLTTINVILLLILNDGFAGNNALLIPVLFLGMLSMVSIGLLIAILSPTQSIATQAGALAMIVIFVSVQVAAFNDSIREVIWILPWHQVLEGIRRAIFSEWGVAQAWLNLLVLSAWAGIFFCADIWALKRREP